MTRRDFLKRSTAAALACAGWRAVGATSAWAADYPAGPVRMIVPYPAGGAADVVGPVFDVIGRKTVWLGEAGRGSQMKLVVNAYLSVLIEGVAETMALADRLGIGHPQLAEVIEGGPLDAPIADAKWHKMDRRDYSAEFPLEWALKDVDLAIRSVGGKGVPDVIHASLMPWK